MGKLELPANLVGVVLPSTCSHSSATWCIMVNASMSCLISNVHAEWYAGYYNRNDKESHTFQQRNPFILQHDIDKYPIDISIIFFNKPMNSFVV